MSGETPGKKLVRLALIDPLDPWVPVEAGLREAIRKMRATSKSLIPAYVTQALETGTPLSLTGTRRAPGQTACLYTVKNVTVGPNFVADFACTVVHNEANEISYLAANMIVPEVQTR